MNKKLSLAISPCPNDSYIFGAWALGLLDKQPEELLTRFFWHDIQELNEAFFIAKYDVIKISAALIKKMDGYEVLPCGGAFGLEDGPKLVGYGKMLPKRIAIPGLYTTAFMMLKEALNYSFEAIPMLFSDIPMAIINGEVDAGLLIHETALLYRQYKFELLLDLGDWWRTETNGLPIPLGLIAVKASLERSLKEMVIAKITQSIMYAKNNLDRLMPFIKSNAQENDETVIRKHIKAYVNKYSENIGEQGQMALLKLADIK